jgi:hypothetical protein
MEFPFLEGIGRTDLLRWYICKPARLEMQELLMPTASRLALNCVQCSAGELSVDVCNSICH